MYYYLFNVFYYFYIFQVLKFYHEKRIGIVKLLLIIKIINIPVALANILPRAAAPIRAVVLLAEMCPTASVDATFLIINLII